MENIQIICTAVIAIATFLYALLTFFIVKETIRLREIQTEPDVVVYLQVTDNEPYTLDIVAKNIGAGPALNVVWSFDKRAPLIVDKKTGLDKIKFLDRVEFFPPGIEYRSLLGGPNLFQEPVSPPLDVSVTYTNRLNKIYSRSFRIDPQELFGRSWIDNNNIHEISRSLQNISRQVDHLTSGFHRLKVDTYSNTDRVREHKKK